VSATSGLRSRCDRRGPTAARARNARPRRSRPAASSAARRAHPPAPRTAAARLRSRSGSISTRSGSSLSPPAKKAPRARPGPQVLHIPPAVSRPAAPAPAVFTRWPEESAACEGIGWPITPSCAAALSASTGRPCPRASRFRKRTRRSTAARSSCPRRSDQSDQSPPWSFARARAWRKRGSPRRLSRSSSPRSIPFASKPPSSALKSQPNASSFWSRSE